MGNYIAGIIGVGIGVVILVGYLMGGGPQAENAYHATRFTGLIFGLLLLAAGGFFLVRGFTSVGPRRRAKKRKKKP